MRKEIELEARLTMIAEMIPKCDILCDIGTDHAYIPIYAVRNHLCKRAVATDINQGPLLIAAKNIESYEVSHMIETRIGDGLNCLSDHELDVILICGMGGLTISEMFLVQKEKVNKCRQLIIQCMYVDELVREYCYQNGLDIVEERICTDRDKLYTAMRVVPGGEPVIYPPSYRHVSKALLEQDRFLVQTYLERRIARLTRILAGVKKARSSDPNEVKKLEVTIEGLKDLKSKN